MTATTCISCRAEGPPDDVPHEPWCPLFMRPVEYPQLTLDAIETMAAATLDDAETARIAWQDANLYYGFSTKAAYEAIQRDKASSPWILGTDTP